MGFVSVVDCAFSHFCFGAPEVAELVLPVHRVVLLNLGDRDDPPTRRSTKTITGASGGRSTAVVQSAQSVMQEKPTSENVDFQEQSLMFRLSIFFR